MTQKEKEGHQQDRDHGRPEDKGRPEDHGRPVTPHRSSAQIFRRKSKFS